MSNSLTVVLPVHNAQQTLEDLVHDTLEVLPDLTQRFEVLIVDDGSVDHTEELAVDLVRAYPQVNLIRHPLSFGIPSAVRTGLERAQGDFVFIHQEPGRFPEAELRQLWMLRDTPPALSPTNLEPASAPSLIERLMTWASELESLAIDTGLPPGSKLIRRAADAYRSVSPVSLPPAPIPVPPAHAHPTVPKGHVKPARRSVAQKA